MRTEVTGGDIDTGCGVSGQRGAAQREPANGEPANGEPANGEPANGEQPNGQRERSVWEFRGNSGARTNATAQQQSGPSPVGMGRFDSRVQ